MLLRVKIIKSETNKAIKGAIIAKKSFFAKNCSKILKISISLGNLYTGNK